jgi:RNA polymerase sigma factor (sigma-70 family)
MTDDEATYRKYSDELVRFATLLVGPADAADVMVDAVLRAFAAPAWPGVANRRAYLYRAVFTTASSWLRSEGRRRRREQHAAGSPVTWTNEPDPQVLDAVATLSPRQRAVVYLTYWEDLTPSAVAGLLNISEGAVRRHLARARTILRRSLDV